MHMDCLTHPEGHDITLEGLVLLNEVESAFGSTVLKIESIHDHVEDIWSWNFWSALSGTLSRCDQMMTSVDIRLVAIADLGSMKAFRTVLQFSPVTSTNLERIDIDIDNLAMAQELRNLVLICPQLKEPVVPPWWCEDEDIPINVQCTIVSNIGQEGWQSLAKAVQLRPGFLEKITSPHHVMQEAKMEDVRVIWEIVGNVDLQHELHDWSENYNRRIEIAGTHWNRLVWIIQMAEEDLKREIESEMKRYGAHWKNKDHWKI